MPKISVGTKVPDFSAARDRRRHVAPQGCRGQEAGDLFLPEGHDLRLHARERRTSATCTPAFRKAGAQVVGVSRDSVASHEKFAAKEKLPFPLLRDADEKVCKLFDVINEKSLYGRKYMGIERSTFLLDGTGVLRQEWRKVKVPGHAEEVLEAAKRL